MKQTDDIIQEYLRVQKEIKALEEKKKRLRSELYSFLKAEGLERYNDAFGNFVVLRKSVRESLDKSRVRELLGEIRFQEVVSSKEVESLMVYSKESLERMPFKS